MLAAVALGLIGWGVLFAHGRLAASLPQRAGRAPCAGLDAEVLVARDAAGRPRIEAATRADAARALGFLHAQDRYFQMDLLRRQAAGELAALVGPVALPSDRRVRPFRLRHVARQALAGLDPRRREILSAYAEGTRAGLAALAGPPFEYVALRAEANDWREEDSLLVVLAMALELEDESAGLDARRGALARTFPPPLARFLDPLGSRWDAPLDGSSVPIAPIPPAEVFDLARPPTGALPGPASSPRPGDELPAPGSNAWAVAGWRAGTGGALVACDMHLPLRLPHIWYRAAYAWTDPDGRRHAVEGVTLPGVPIVVAGSTGRVAWGFTNAYGDWSDRALIEIDPRDPDRYRTPGGWRRFERAVETIAVAGGPGEPLVVEETIWGPLVARRDGVGEVAVWVSRDPTALDFAWLDIETAQDVDQVLDVAARAGMPHQNVVAGDGAGRIGWTVTGRIPRRVGHDGRLPLSWSNGEGGWSGWLDPHERPRIVDPPEGFLWTANARTAGGEALARLGDGGYALGARAGRIRERLAALERASPADMLAIQLDVRASWLDAWRELLLGALPAWRGEPEVRAVLEDLVREESTHAGTDARGYRIVRAFRSQVVARVLEPFAARVRATSPAFDWRGFFQIEEPVRALVEARPRHLLDPRFASWDELFGAAIDAVVAELGPSADALRGARWGASNRLSMGHPFSRAFPPLAAWLDAPVVELPGDLNVPRVQTPRFGASERFAVEVGLEGEGILHMPGGASGHPLSAWYLAGHDDWVAGRPAPFAIGPARFVLRLAPPRSASEP